jgi:hypothetical protein
MKRNKKAEKQKQIIRLKKERDDIWQTIHNQNWIELEKPIPHGWDGYWVLRSDISRGPEAERLQHIIDTYGRSVWCRRKDFKKKEWNTKKLADVKPSFKKISESDYEKLTDKMKRYFVLDTSKRYGNMWWKPTYMVYIDTWKLEVKSKRSYKTHYREHDEILYQMQSENKSHLYNLTPAPWGSYRSPKWWKRSERRKAKTKHRAENRRIINAHNGGGDVDDFDCYTTYCTDSMHYW